MNRLQWINGFTLINNKINKKSALTCDEVDELLEFIEAVKQYISKVEYEILKKL